MNTEILLGDEAVALGALHAGLTGAYSYPGTPASEIMEYLIKAAPQHPGLRAAWSVNEKVAYEEALGVSFAGKRAHGLDEACGAERGRRPFHELRDHRRQRRAGRRRRRRPGHAQLAERAGQPATTPDFARIPCLEPANHQEAYDMTPSRLRPLRSDTASR